MSRINTRVPRLATIALCSSLRILPELPVAWSKSDKSLRILGSVDDRHVGGRTTDQRPLRLLHAAHLDRLQASSSGRGSKQFKCVACDETVVIQHDRCLVVDTQAQRDSESRAV